MPRRRAVDVIPASFLDAVIIETGLTYAEAGRRCVPPAENGEAWRLAKKDEGREIDMDWANRFSPALNIAGLDLLEGKRRRIPLEWHVAAQFSEEHTGPYQICGAAREWFESTQKNLKECFAAIIDDDSADRLGWPARTVLHLRRTEHADLHFAAVVLVRVLAGANDTAEVFVGRLGKSHQGDLIVSIHSSNAHVPSAIIVRYAAPRPLGFAEDQARLLVSRADHFDYKREPSDRAEILGIVEVPLPRAGG